LILKSISTLIGQILKLENFIREKTEKLEAKNQLLQHALEQSTAKYGIVGNSDKLLRALSDLEKVASSSAKVLLLGESGTGKELFARAIHLSSSRKSQPFIKINCSAIPDTLFEAELFGYEKGAFTGATSSSPGWFEKANKGTIFLDEIGELPIQMQAKLLRTLQEQTVVRLGGKSEIKVDFRLVSATNQDLQQAIRLGRFREDLFYRINTVAIPLPSLSERRDDIEPLVIYFLNKANQAHQKNCRLTPGAIYSLQEYGWPGNIRELSNLIERLVILVGDDLIDELEVKKFLSEPKKDPERPVVKHFDGFGIREYSHTYESNPAELLEALKNHHWNQSRASQALGMTTRQLSYRLKKLGIDIPAKK
jgi:Nif-specific regulatory protein